MLFSVAYPCLQELWAFKRHKSITPFLKVMFFHCIRKLASECKPEKICWYRMKLPFAEAAQKSCQQGIFQRVLYFLL